MRGLFKSECACSWKALRGRHYTGLRCHHCGTYSCVFIIFKVVVQYKFIFYVDIRVAKSRFLFDGRLYERFSVTALAFTKKSRTSRSLIISCFQMLRLVSQPVFFYFFFFVMKNAELVFHVCLFPYINIQLQEKNSIVAYNKEIFNANKH